MKRLHIFLFLVLIGSFCLYAQEKLTMKTVLVICDDYVSAENNQIADGVKAIVERLRAKLPDTKILLLGIFPRGADGQDPIRQINEKANAIFSKLADERTVFYLDIGPKFLKDDGTLPRDVMPDLLHPNAKGYEIWAEAIEPSVAKLMGEK